jgi:hypothetical protein
MTAGIWKTQADYELELAKLRALVSMYEQLDNTGSDQTMASALNILRGALGAVQSGARLVRDGMTTAENALRALERMLDTLRTQTSHATQGLADLMQLFRTAESVVVAVLGSTLPLTDSVRNFFGTLVDKLPLGIGENIKRALDSLANLIRAIPTTVDTVTGQLLKPLADNFFPATGTAPVKTAVIDPITNNLLEPLKKTLDSLEALATSWDKDLSTPVQSAFDARQKIRDQIAAYRRENKI